jgi:light-regulated signal transduction histidine kinase (bacteriophytochrome)
MASLTKALNDQQGMVDAFIKASQYIVRLTAQQDVWDHLGKLIATYFPADWTAFAQRTSEGTISLDRCSLSDTSVDSRLLTEEVRSAIADVLDSGFLTMKLLSIPFPSTTVFLPISGESLQKKVMLIGHNGAEQIPKNVLDIYLSIAGLAGAAFERLESERELTSHKQHLEEMIKSATAQLAQRAKELALSNQDLEHFAYVASHDLQEPLRAVTGFLGLLKKEYGEKLDATANEYVSHAVDGAERMSRLIYDLLAYSRIDSKGRNPTPIDANNALEGALVNLSSSLEAAGAKVTHDELPWVLGDPTQISQLFQNLVGNAIKFKHDGRPCEIHVGTFGSGGWVTLFVKDNGIGIPQDQFERIFIIFQRLHTRDKYPGTGIGLAICKRIVERQGGRIWLESTPGEGATFYFTLPVAGNAGKG